VRPAWDDNHVMIQAEILAYDQFAHHDDCKFEAEIAGAKIASR